MNEPISPKSAIQAWQQAPSPENADRMFQTLDPYIRQSVRKYTGKDSSVAFGRAKVELLKSLPRYDANRTQPQTFINTQLQGLQRWEASRLNGVRVPTRVPAAALKIEQTAAELEDRLGRPASTAEIARKANMTVSMVTQIRTFKKPTVGSQEVGLGDDDEDPTLAEDQVQNRTSDQAWLELVYDDLPDQDKVVMEYTVGMFGRKPLSTSELAKKLKVSPGAVSQRRKRVQAYIDRAMQVNPF